MSAAPCSQHETRGNGVGDVPFLILNILTLNIPALFVIADEISELL
jgi:hypothetical protein